MIRIWLVMAIVGILPASMKADILAAINTPGGATSSTVEFIDPLSLTLGSSFNAPVVLEGIALGGNSDIYVSSGNTIYHYSLAGNLLGSGTIGTDDVVQLSYYNGTLWAASNGASSSTITQLNPSTLATVSSFDATGLGPLSGVSASQYGIYVSGAGGIVLSDTSGNVLANPGSVPGVGPVSAVPDAVYTSINFGSGWLVGAFGPNFFGGLTIGPVENEPGIAGVAGGEVFFSDGPNIGVVSGLFTPSPTPGFFFGGETDNFGNLSYQSTAPEPGTLGLIGFSVAAFVGARRLRRKA
jgi:hypothetical protein